MCVCALVEGREEWESECQKCTFTETESHCYHIGQHISICGIVIFYFNCNNKLCQALFMRAYVCIRWMEVERGMILVVCLDDVHIMLYMLLRMCLFTLVNVANFLIFAVRCVLHWEIVMWCVILFFPFHGFACNLHYTKVNRHWNMVAHLEYSSSAALIPNMHWSQCTISFAFSSILGLTRHEIPKNI